MRHGKSAVLCEVESASVMSTRASSTVGITPPDGLPAFVRLRDGLMLRPEDNIALFLARELDVSRLEAMAKKLWLAGRLGNIRPLHRQHELGRRVIVTESLDMHLVWSNNILFVKPLPPYLLDDHFVEEHVNGDEQLLKAMNGFLLSYCRLINHRSDFLIAKECNLIPSSFLVWEDWKSLVEEKLQHIVTQYQAHNLLISTRFRFGELRMGRVDVIYRFFYAENFSEWWRGYSVRTQTYRSFLYRHFAWLIAAFAYITIVLTAMQVGLGTEQLRDNSSFNRACFGFTVFSILIPLAAVVLVGLVSLVLTWWHVNATLKHFQTSGY